MQFALIFLYIDIIAYLIIGIFLTIRAVQTKKYNVVYYSLEIFFLTLFFIVVGAFSKQTQAVDAILIIGYLLSMLTSFSGLIFIKKTFYEEKESPFKIYMLIGFIGTSIIISLFILLLFSVITFEIFEAVGDITFAGFYIVMLIWLSIISFDEYKRVKNFNIEPFVKKRYYILGLTSIAAIIGLGSMIVATFLNLANLTLFYVIAFTMTSIISLVRTGCNYLIWIMPTPFKRFLNKGFTHSDGSKEMSEEEIMRQMKEEK